MLVTPKESPEINPFEFTAAIEGIEEVQMPPFISDVNEIEDPILTVSNPVIVGLALIVTKAVTTHPFELV
jgi:hypothetical protein